MSPASPVLPRFTCSPYRPDVPRLPKNFRIDWVSIEQQEPGGYLATGPDTAIPTRFEAHFQLGHPEAAVTIVVFVGSELRPAVVEMRIHSRAGRPITTSALRQVLVDQLLQAAIEAATVPASVRQDWLASLPDTVRPPDHELSSSSSRSPQGQPDQRDIDAQTAAQIYAEARARGSNAPAVAVANTMNRSRAQAARYIRRARKLGLLPPLDSSEQSSGRDTKND